MVQKMSGGSTFAIPESGESWVERTTSPPPIISLTEERKTNNNCIQYWHYAEQVQKVSINFLIFCQL